MNVLNYALRKLWNVIFKRQKILRQPCCKRLFISYLKPYKHITSTTKARWIKLFLIKCSITEFGAHSTRSASTACVFEAGLSVIDIMKTADWSQQSTFSKFYKRHTVEGMFGRMVLQKSSI
jgi:integrase